MRSFLGTIVLAVALAFPLAAQQRGPGLPPARSASQTKSLAPVLPHWQSYKPESTSSQQLRAAVAADRDLTSEKIAILVVAVILLVVIVRAVN